MPAAIGAFFASLWAWFLKLASAGEVQKCDDQIAKDADEIQSLKDMQAITEKNAALSDADLTKQLYAQTSARPPQA